jgi:L-amino acid N-acyltransferase YncA
MSDIILRPFAPHDAAPIAKLYAHYVDTSTITFDTDQPTAQGMADKFAAYQSLGHPTLVAEGDGRLLGYAYASFYRPRFGWRLTCENSVYLAPEAQGKGLGTRMLTQLIEEAKAAGFAHMIGVITSESAASLALHRKLGFVDVGVLRGVGHKFDRWLDIVLLQRVL